MIWQHKIELFIFISSAWMNGEAGGDSPSDCSSSQHAGKEVPRGWPILCMQLEAYFLHKKRNWGILSFHLCVLKWSVVTLTPASFVSHFIPQRFTLKQAVAASFSIAHLNLLPISL